MIRCSKCGSLNRDGSHFCNECGAELQPTSIRCPVCGANNPVGRVFCDQCHARLVPSEGMVPPEDEEDKTDTEVGMRKLSLPTRSTSVGEGEKPSDQEAFPDWLQELLDEAPGEEGAVERKSAVPPFAEDAEVAPGGLPDWLSPSASEEEVTEPEARPQQKTTQAASGEEKAPDWLADLDPAEDTSDRDEVPEELPDWLSDLEPDTERAAEELAPAEEELPDWLSPPVSEEEVAEPEARPEREAAQAALGEKETPDWSVDLEQNEEASDRAPAPEELPDWLAPSTGEEEVAEPEEPSQIEAEKRTADEELPDWLANLEGVEETSDRGEAPLEELPDWLRGMAADEEEPVEAPTSGKVPDWLASLAAEEEGDVSEVEEGRGEAEVFSAPISDEVEEVSSEDLTEAQIETLAEKPLPESGEPSLEREELPDWLRNLEPVESENEVSEKEVVSDASKPVSVPEVKEEIEPPEAAPAEPERVERSAVVSEITEESPEEERPEEEPEEESAVFVAEAEDIEETEIPEWLRELGPAAVEPGEAVETRVPEGLEQADLPGWLRDLKPPGTGPLPKRHLSEEEIAKAAEEGLVRANIPDWVQSLQPTGEAAEMPRVIPDEMAAAVVEPEVEGPLGGMQVTLPPRSLVDMPEDFQLAMGLEPPEHVVEEAQFWQELLERPREKERVIIQRRTHPRWLENVLRVGIFLMLSVVMLTVVIWGVVPTSLFSPPQQPSVLPLQAAVRNLQPGDTVAVALEYGPAEAAEMNLLIEAVFDHLLERDVRVQALSTIPVGEALVQERLKWAEGKLFQDESRTLENLGYWPGGSSGIASFLGSAPGGEEIDLLLVFTARPERLRWWVEQNAALGAAARPLGIGVSAAVGPLVKPYFLGEEVEGWLVGVQGAAAYWQARGEPDANVMLRAQTLMFMQWVAAGTLLLGLVVSLLSPKRNRST